MDVFERVREVNAGAGLSEDRISGARARLLQGIDAGRTAERKRLLWRPMFLIAGAVAGVAAVTATAVVFAQPSDPAPAPIEAVPVATPDPRVPGETIPKPDPTAGAVVTEPFPGTTPQAGQYVRVDATTDTVYYRAGNGDASQGISSFTAPPIAAAVMRSSSSTTMPADRSQEWSASRGPSNELVRDFGADESAFGSGWESVVPYSSEVTVERFVGGLVVGDRTGVGGPGYYDDRPRDPQGLLASWRDFFSRAGSSRDESVVSALLSVLTSNLAPGDVRSAYLQALQMSDGVSVDATDGSVVTYAVAFHDVDARTEWISIDLSTGWVTGYAVKYARADGGLVPSDVPDIRTTFTVTIVDPAR